MTNGSLVAVAVVMLSLGWLAGLLLGFATGYTRGLRAQVVARRRLR